MSVSSVLERYSAGAKEREEALCCPVDYDKELLKILPAEIIERDYGCGDPSRYVKEGDTVLDLGSGGGKICYMAAQLVGEKGRVIGVDMNDDMLALARKYEREMQDKTGVEVEFHKGQIQDLALSLETTEQYLAEHPVNTTQDLLALKAWQEKERRERPMIPDNSVDLIVSNCVLNLVGEADRAQLISEIHRVLKPGGRVAISDIVSDEYVPTHLKQDETLWSGCISGAFQEHELLETFANNGFRAVAYDKWDAEPWQVVEGIEFRSVTVSAFKGKEGPCWERNQAVIYRGPFREVLDDDGHTIVRGQRTAVCDKTFTIFASAPYRDHFDLVEPRIAVPHHDARPFDCSRTTVRAPSETKGEGYEDTVEPTEACCGPDGCC